MTLAAGWVWIYRPRDIVSITASNVLRAYEAVTADPLRCLGVTPTAGWSPVYQRNIWTTISSGADVPTHGLFPWFRGLLTCGFGIRRPTPELFSYLAAVTPRLTLVVRERQAQSDWADGARAYLRERGYQVEEHG